MSALASGDKKTSDAIIVREVVASATQDIDMSADALPRLNEANTIVIPAWSARQLWFEIHTKTLSPGDWKATVSLKDMAVSAEVVTAPLTVSVWSVTQSTKNAFKFCGWANTSPKGVLDDMLSHGMNVFTDGPKTAARFDADGKITGINYMLLDDYMKRLAGRGIVMFHNFAHLTGPAKMYSPVWNKAYVASVKLISARIKELGYDYGDYAYYPVDEPGLEEGRNVARFMLTAPLTREADPKIRIYANPTEGITTEHLKQMSPNIDIYAPYIAHIKTRYLDMMRVNSEEMWTYNCLDNVKHKSPLGYNRAQMWSCFNRGYTGGGIYTYSRDISSRTQKFWHMTNTEFDLVYPGNDGPVPSKRWEAVRDGIEDYSMLMALKSAANTPGADPALVKRARTLISVDAVTIGNYCGIDDDGFSPTESGLPAVRKVADKRWKMIVATRREMRDLLKAFAK